MIETITIKDLAVTSGISKNGRGYNMVKITTEDGRKMSMYVDKERGERAMRSVGDWTEGTTLNVRVEQNGDYLNFDIPSKLDLLEETVSNLSERVLELERVIENAKKTKKSQTD